MSGARHIVRTRPAQAPLPAKPSRTELLALVERRFAAIERLERERRGRR